MRAPKIVPKNKTVYSGTQRFVEGDILPPHVCLEDPTVVITKTKKKAKKTDRKKSDKKKNQKGKRNERFNY